MPYRNGVGGGRTCSWDLSIVRKGMKYRIPIEYSPGMRRGGGEGGPPTVNNLGDVVRGLP